MKVVKTAIISHMSLTLLYKIVNARPACNQESNMFGINLLTSNCELMTNHNWAA